MARIDGLRADITAALCNPNFSAVAARLTGGYLRQVVANKLIDEDVDVVVISASGIGSTPPFREAEIIWQLPKGGEFQHQTLRWDLAPGALEAHRPSNGFVRIVTTCAACHEHNELVISADAAEMDVQCSNCGAGLGIVSHIEGARRGSVGRPSQGASTDQS